MIREIGGVLGIAVLVAIFSAAGGYGSGQAFVDGLVPAVYTGAGVLALGALAALRVPRIRNYHLVRRGGTLGAPATKGTRMQIEVHGRNLPVTPPLREYVGKRFQRLDRLFTRECTCDVELSVERNPRIAESQIAEATLLTRGHVVRARSTAIDMYAAIDGARRPCPAAGGRPLRASVLRPAARTRRAPAEGGAPVEEDRRRPRPGGDRPS